MKFSAEDYRKGALERLRDAQILYDQQRWVGTCCFAGRAVESMLLALLRTRTHVNETGHDLNKLLKVVVELDIVARRGKDESLYDDVNLIAVVWQNNLRFVDQGRLLRHLKAIKMDRNIKGDAVKYWATQLLEASEAVVNRGDVIWNRLLKN